MGLFMWFDNVEESLTVIQSSLKSLHKKVDTVMASLQELVDLIGAWGMSWRDRAQAAEASAAASDAARASAVAALEAFQADDAATDAAQLQAQVDADAAVAQEKWDALQALDAPPPEPPAE